MADTKKTAPMTAEHNRSPSLKQCQNELAIRLLKLADFLNMALGGINYHPGLRLLNLEEGPIPDEFEELDLQTFKLGRNLPYFYEYAFNAKRIVSAFDWHDWTGGYGERQLLQEFLEVTDCSGVETAQSGIDFLDAKSVLWEMLRRADARYHLDFGEPLTLSEVALLANMNEKSVRNALRADGENRLVSSDNEHVDNYEALRWLRSRRGGFQETEIEDYEGDLPSHLSYAEISPFVLQRLLKRFDTDGYGPMSLAWREAVAKETGWSEAQLCAITEDASNIRIEDCQQIAKFIQVDPAWFTEQVLCARYPKQMELVLFRREIEPIPSRKSAPESIEVLLTEAGIRNGYLPIPASYAAFFPDDCFGDRSQDKQGQEIELRFGDSRKQTDIRVKSSVSISPRARFGAYFKTIGAKAGDIIRISKIDDRIFELTHVSS